MKNLHYISLKRWNITLLFMLVVSYVHAATVTYTADLSNQDQLSIISRGTAYSVTTSPATEASFTYSGMLFYSNGAYMPQGNTELRVYAGKSLEITSYVGNITKVVITVSASKFMNSSLTTSDKITPTKDKDNLRYTFTLTSKSISSFSFKTNDLIWISKIAVTIEQPTSYPLSVSQFGYSSLFHGEYDLQLPSNQSDLTAYTLTYKDGLLEPTHTFYAGDIIPKGTPVLVKGAQGTYNLAVSTAASTAEYDNELLGLDVPGMIVEASNSDDYYYYYKLTTLNKKNFGFYWGADNGEPFELKNAHRAYLRLPKSLFGTNEQAKAFDLDDVLDVITDAKQEQYSSTKIFDLQGRQVSHPVKGIYICNGKKVLIR